MHSEKTYPEYEGTESHVLGFVRMRGRWGDGAWAHQVRICIALPEDLSSVANTHNWALYNHHLLAPGGPTFFFCLLGEDCTHLYKLKQTQRVHVVTQSHLFKGR